MIAVVTLQSMLLFVGVHAGVVIIHFSLEQESTDVAKR